MTETVSKNVTRLYNFQYRGKNIDTLVIGDNVKRIDNFAFYGSNINTIYYYSDAKLSDICKKQLSKTNIIYKIDTDKPQEDWEFKEKTSELDFSNINLNKGESISLASNKLDKDVKIIIENTDVAEINDKGEIISKNPGETIVTVKDTSGNSQQIVVNVPEEKPQVELKEFDDSKETPLEYFTYYIYDDYSIITGVAEEHKNDNVPNLIFPSKIGGKPLTQIRIGYGFDGIMVNNFGTFNNWGVRYIKIPDTVELITRQAFYNIGTLEKVDLPTTSPKYYDECYDTEFLSELNRDYATSNVFSFCDGLKKVVIPNGWNRIPAHYFNLCHNLEEVIIPDSIKEIGEGAFGGCEKLSKFNIPENLKSYEGFLSQGNLEKQFTELTFPESCTSVKEHAFAYIYLNKLTFKGRVEIGDSAFRDGQFIELILEKGASNAAELSNSHFRYSKCGTLRVPKEEIDNYKHLTCFNRILPLVDEEIAVETIPCEKLDIYVSKSPIYKIPGHTSNLQRYIINKDESINITYTKYPFDTTDRVTFESNKPEFVKVSSNGKITGVNYLYFDPDPYNRAKSYATITVKCGNVERTINVCVEQ